MTDNLSCTKSVYKVSSGKGAGSLPWIILHVVVHCHPKACYFTANNMTQNNIRYRSTSLKETRRNSLR